MWQRDNYQPQRGSWKSFLGLLTRHRAIDKLRKRNTTQKLLARCQLCIAPSTLPLEEAQSQERQKQLQKALSLLPVEQRAILIDFLHKSPKSRLSGGKR